MSLLESKEKDNWTTIIEPKGGWLDIDLKGLWNYRDLVILFVRRDFVAVYKQTILGPFWFLLQPLFSTLIFTVILSCVNLTKNIKLPKYASGLENIKHNLAISQNS